MTAVLTALVMLTLVVSILPLIVGVVEIFRKIMR